MIMAGQFRERLADQVDLSWGHADKLRPAAEIEYQTFVG
jgi:hypothetical protein